MQNQSITHILQLLKTSGQKPDAAQAIRLQNTAAKYIIQSPPPAFNLKTIAGADVSVKGELARAAIAVMDMETFSLIEIQTVSRPLDFPYIPGLLAFREAPALMEAFSRLTAKPGAVLVDGQGLCHPRLFGLACHFGLAMDIPAIGVAKSRLVGEGPEPGSQKGEWAPVQFKNQIVARALRSRTGVKPIYISIGHRMDLPTAFEIVMRSLTRFRLPEPIRAAHNAAGNWK